MKYLIWIAAFALRAVLIVAGWFLVPISVINGRTPYLLRWFGDVKVLPPPWHGTSKWKQYTWYAWRNPTNGLKAKLRQPIPENKPNPDNIVRGPFPKKSASRFMVHGIFWEYWYLRTIDIGKYKFFEFRIGWKFVDGNDEFFPTIQLGPRST